MPLSSIDIAYLFFAFVTMFFSFLMFVLYYENKKNLRATPELKEPPPITIIIPAYNEEKSIAGTIQAVLNFNYPKEKLKMIVVDHSSKDRTGEIARQFPITVLKKTREGKEQKAHALNYGLKFVDTDFVACVDADSYPEPDSLIKAVANFTSPEVGAVTTSIFVKDPRNFIEKLQHLEYILIVWARKLLENIGGVYVTPGPLSLYRLSALKEVGGFDEKNMTEDIEIAWSLMNRGYKIKMSLDSIVFTNPPTKFKQWWHQRMRWNIGGIQTSLKYMHTLFKKEHGSIGTFVLPFFFFSYVISVFGMAVFTYITLSGAWNFFDIVFKSYQTGASLKSPFLFDYIFLPSIFTIFGIFIFFLSLWWIRISLKSANKKISGLSGIFELLIYLSIYITIFPFSLLYSGIKYITKGAGEW